LVQVYNDQGRYDKAAELLPEIVEFWEREFGYSSPRALHEKDYLAFMLFRLGHFEEAEPYFTEILEARKLTLGEAHPDTLETMGMLGSVYFKIGRHDEARALVAEQLALGKRMAEDSKADANKKNDYAWELLTCEPADLRDPAEALLFALEANEMTGFQDADHLDTLARAYYLTGDTEKAIETQKEAISLESNIGAYLKRLKEYEASRDLTNRNLSEGSAR
jgi:tetratricopeptide (TPR) repeat protein